ncbi:MAG TPA: antibiotic biosynthesis monooxygenase family protein [Thermoanaerobaculia bacterium]|nr:antibiotic biosynthesis monooxygenase family protein [Thermoanaerobaculia bacterium]
MKKLAIIVGLTSIVWFGCATNANHSGSAMPPAVESSRTVVAREWKGRVAPARADEYYAYLSEGVKKMRTIRGYLGAEIMRRDEPTAVGFTVISYWETREAIKAYAGEDIEKPHHLPRDREMLLELPERVLHYDVTFTDLMRVRLQE